MWKILRAGGRIFLFLSAYLLVSLSTCVEARSQERQVDLALVLAVDVSGSINTDRWGLQRNGYVDAFMSPAVISAITRGQRRAVAVTMVQWASSTEQRASVGWHVIHDEHSSKAFAAKISDTPRLYTGSTGIGAAIDFCSLLLSPPPFGALRRVIDISGDGTSNSGGLPSVAREFAVRKGITINGLPIVADEKNIVDYYRRQVVGGPGAFLVVAENFQSFAIAIRHKLVLEIASR